MSLITVRSWFAGMVGLLLIAGIIVGLVPSATTHAATLQAAPPQSGTIVEGQSVANVRLGDSRTSVTNKWGAGVRSGSQQVYFMGSGEIRVFFNRSNRVSSIYVIDLPRFRTTRGIDTNDFRQSFDAVDRAYPQARVVGGGRAADGVIFQRFQSFTRGLYTQIIIR